jgi:predicted ATPase/transcriptional regulator with XRE-family HTH domain
LAAVRESAGLQPGGQTFGQRLRVLREAARMTQAELAERAGMSVNGVSALERGVRRRPYPHTVRTLAEALALGEDERAFLFDGVRPRPAAAPAAPTSGTLPTPATSLVGRDPDVAEIVAALSGPWPRLLTLTGPGGVGKTRLAIEVARRASARFRDGAAFVPLAPVSDPAAVPAAVSRALGLRETGTEEPGREDPVAALAELLRPRELLLVLDNFEHVATAAPAVADVLAGCPDVTVLVTSRSPLRVRGEQERVVEPLPLPASTPDPDPDEVAASAAGELFVARARSVMPSFRVTSATASDVAAICWRLSGLPLALELAAANVRVLPPAALLDRLDQALATGWSLDLPARQRGLRTTLDWSYDLLDRPAQALLPRLSVFVGGFDLDGAEMVAAPALAAPDVLPAVGNLVEHSLVSAVHDEDGGVRYDMLEPIRQYAGSMLDDVARRQVTAAHARRHLRLVEEAAPALQTGEQVEAMRRLERDDGNIRLAIAASLQAGDATTAARMCWAMWLAWWLRGGDRQGREWAEAALRADLDDDVRTGAALAAACLAYIQSDLDVAAGWWEDALACARRTGDVAMECNGVAGLGLAALGTGDLTTAERCISESLVLAEQGGADWLRSLALVWLGTVRLVQQDADTATDFFERGLASARRRGDRLVTYVALYNLAQAATAEGRLELASEMLREGVALSQETGDRVNTAHFLDALAVVEGEAGRWERAAWLLGAAAAARSLSHGSGYHYYLPDGSLEERTVAGGRAALGVAFDRAVERGRAVPVDEAIDDVLAAGPDGDDRSDAVR